MDYKVHKIEVPTPFVVGPINVYLLDGHPLTLIDVGPLTEDAYRTLADGISRAGHKINDIQRVILTHWHPDHFGLTDRIKTEADAVIYAHERDRNIIEDYFLKYERMVTVYKNYILKTGVPEDIVNMVLKYYKLMNNTAKPVKVNYVLKNTDKLEMNNSELNVVHCPGHTSGSISLYDKANKFLFSGDNLLKEITTNAFFKGSKKKELTGVLNYETTLRKLRALEVEEVFPGHGDNVYEHKTLIDNILSQLSGRRNKILQILDNRKMRAWEITQALFPNLPISEVWLGLAEVLGHLELLETERKVESVEDNGYIYYSVK